MCILLSTIITNAGEVGTKGALPGTKPLLAGWKSTWKFPRTHKQHFWMTQVYYC